MIKVRHYTHEQALDFIGPVEPHIGLAGFYFTTDMEPDLDPQGPYGTEPEARQSGIAYEGELETEPGDPRQEPAGFYEIKGLRG